MLTVFICQFQSLLLEPELIQAASQIVLQSLFTYIFPLIVNICNYQGDFRDSGAQFPAGAEQEEAMKWAFHPPYAADCRGGDPFSSQWKLKYIGRYFP